MDCFGMWHCKLRDVLWNVENGGWEGLTRENLGDFESSVDGWEDADAVAAEIVEKAVVERFGSDESDAVGRVAHESVPLIGKVNVQGSEFVGLAEKFSHVCHGGFGDGEIVVIRLVFGKRSFGTGDGDQVCDWCVRKGKWASGHVKVGFGEVGIFG